MQRWLCLLLVLLIASSINRLLAQQPSYSISHTRFSVDNGLSQAFVYSIFQDSYGFLWFGTKKGLNRYDGSHFKVFDQATSGLQDDHVFKLLEDQNQRLWVMYNKRNNSRKIDIIDLATGSVMSFDSLFQYTELRNDQLFAIEQTEQGRIWLETITGEVYELTADDKFKLIFANSSDLQTHFFPTEDGSFIFFETDAEFKEIYNFDATTGQTSLLISGVSKVVTLYNSSEKSALLALRPDRVSIYDYQKNSLLPDSEQHWMRNVLKTLPSDDVVDYYELRTVYHPLRDLYWLSLSDRIWGGEPTR